MSCINSGESSCEKGDEKKPSMISSAVQVLKTEDGSDKIHCKSSGDQLKNDESSGGISPVQPVGAVKTQTQSTKQKKQKNQEKSPVETWRGPQKCIESKQRNNQHKFGQQKNFNGGPSQSSITGKMNHMSISETRRPTQNGFQRNGNGQNQNRGQSNWRNQNQRQEVVSQTNFQANNRSLLPPHQNQAGLAFDGSRQQINAGYCAELMHRQAFPPPYSGNQFCGAYRSAPNSPGPVNSQGHLDMRPDVLSRSPSFPGPDNFNGFPQFGAPNVLRNDFVQSPPPINGQPLVSPPIMNGVRPNYLEKRFVEVENQRKFTGQKLHNGNSLGNQGSSSDAQNRKKQGNKMWKKNHSQPSLMRDNRNSYTPSTSPVGAAIPNTNVTGMIPGGVPLYYPNQDAFVNPPNFVVPISMPPPVSDVPNCMPPPVSSVPSAPTQQYVNEQQYSVAFYQGGNFMPHQQWVPVTEGQGNFVPFSPTEMVPYTMVPGMIPHTTVPYTMPPNVVPFTNGPNVVPFTTIPYTTGIPEFVPTVPPPVPANVNSQVLSFTVSSRVGPITAPTEDPKHQFRLSQLERSWENNSSHQKFQNSPAQTPENVPPPGFGVKNNQNEPARRENSEKGAAWLPDKLKKMLDVSSLEKIQRMSSTNGNKRAPMNARNKESPNHMPPASPPDVQEEVIKFICDSWNKVYQEYQKGSPAVAYHVEADPSTLPEGFVPFDLEAYWGKRLVQNMTTQNIPTQNM